MVPEKVGDGDGVMVVVSVPVTVTVSVPVAVAVVEGVWEGVMVSRGEAAPDVLWMSSQSSSAAGSKGKAQRGKLRMFSFSLRREGEGRWDGLPKCGPGERCAGSGVAGSRR